MRGKQANCISHSVAKRGENSQVLFPSQVPSIKVPSLGQRTARKTTCAVCGEERGGAGSSQRPQLGGPAQAIGMAHRPNAQ